jgi:hypothetical protein
MTWLKSILKALSREPEVWLAYLYGQQYQLIFNGVKGRPRYSGLLLRLVAYGRTLIQVIQIQSRQSVKKSIDVVVFAGTANQASALNETVKHLRLSALKIHLIAGQGAAGTLGEFTTDDCERIKLSIGDVLKVVLLTSLRVCTIWRDLANKDRRLKQWCFDSFLRCHIYMVYFEKVLTTTNPQLVLMSNDHNEPQRCLLALARLRGVKTAYLQHASVSKIFPSLCFDYCFLDGQVALETYVYCEPNKLGGIELPEQRHIFLTGQKKPVIRSKEVGFKNVGLAINSLDKMKDVMVIVAALTESGYDVLMRWHPATSLANVKDLKKACSRFPTVKLSDPNFEKVADFLKRVSVLIAANSSIHLEAAIAGVMPIYFEISPGSIQDYYGYVKNRVSVAAHDTNELLNLIREVQFRSKTLNSSAVQAYSATFGTDWEGREGELTAAIVKDLLSGIEPSKCFGYMGLMNLNMQNRPPN